MKSTRQLVQAGLDTGEIARLVAAGELTRIGRGWYATSFADERVVRAMRAGARLGCLSGCRFHGLWVPHDPHLHAAYCSGGKPGPKPGVLLHPAGRPYPADAVWPLEDCLVQAARQHDPETALVLVESARNTGLLSRTQIHDVIARLPVRRRDLMRFLRPAESGSETRVRFFLQQRRVPVRAQVELPGIGRVDLLVGDRLIIECDSDEHHRSKEQHQEDRRRDLAARLLGYETVRLTYHQIWFDWGATQAALLRLLHARQHIRRPGKGRVA